MNTSQVSQTVCKCNHNRERQAAGAALNSDTQRCGGEAPPLWQQYAADIILAKIFDKYEKIRYLLYV